MIAVLEACGRIAYQGLRAFFEIINHIKLI